MSDYDVIIAGGTESMSTIPLLYGPRMTELFMHLSKAKTLKDRLRVLFSFRPSFLKPVIGLKQGLTDPVCGLIMGLTAEVLAREFHISRDEQDLYALQSHQRALNAAESGLLTLETVPVAIPPAYKKLQMEDEGPRPDETIEHLQKLRPYFDRKTGTVTVGNSCQITDGAAAVLLMAALHGAGATQGHR